MNPLALSKAKSRLRLAKKAVDDLPNCNSMDKFTDTWFSFLTAFKSVYTVLEQGSKSSPQSRQWFGSKSSERKQDPLLQYVYQARNDDEHGLNPNAELIPGSVAIGVAADGYSNSIMLNGSAGPGNLINMTATSLDGKPVMSRITPARVILSKITARGNVDYHPPETHLGQHIGSNAPMPVARLAVAYLEKLVNEASGLA